MSTHPDFQLSMAQRVAALPAAEREAILTDLDPEGLLWDWSFWGRPSQFAPTDEEWNIWLVCSGRGFGKTRLAAEWVREQARYTTTGTRRFALVARTAADVRDVIVEGNSGIVNVTPPSERPLYEPSKRRLTWPNGNTATCFTADEPGALRGPEFRLDIETPLPTPTGWTTMGELAAGDTVFDELGQATQVTAVHPIELAVDAYRVTFSDGTYLDADDQHLWITLTGSDIRHTGKMGGIPQEWARMRLNRESKSYIPKTTKQIRESLKKQHYIPTTQPVLYASEQFPVDLPIDPWVLGMVLGDGASRSPSYIATSEADKPFLLGQLEARGYAARSKNADHVWADDLIEHWRALGLYKNKHVPDIYLRASMSQRLELLRGLIDSDGGVEPTGAFRFYNTNERLIEAVEELARSLGLAPKRYVRKARSRGAGLNQVSWYVQMNSTIPLAHNPRKLAGARYRWANRAVGRYIVSVEPITPVLMRCITVDSASHLYLAGVGMVPTHNTHAWGDEVAAWRRLPDDSGLTAWDNLRIATRLGTNPKIILTTTPKRAPLMMGLIEEAASKPVRVRITYGSTKENQGNLSEAYTEGIYGIYGGTRLAAQELDGQMLGAQEGALWTEEMIEDHRRGGAPMGLPLRVVGVDPSVAERPTDECGIVVLGSTADRDLYRREAYVLEDASVLGSPDVWANRVVAMARKWGCPVVAEVNQGGALVANAIHTIDPTIKVYEVHSKVGKQLRAEPVSLAYQQGRVHHIGYHAELESQMLDWIPGEGKSPDRIDALVHGLTALMIKPPLGFLGGTITAKSHADRRIPMAGNRARGARIIRPR